MAKGCDCFYCTGYTKDLIIDLKEKIADREIIKGIIEYENRYDELEDYLNETRNYENI